MLGAAGSDSIWEGDPALLAFPSQTKIALGDAAPIRAPVNIADLKRNAAIVAVTAFGIAERAAPLGPRQSRAEIEPLLKTWGLEGQMKATGNCQLWESSERARMP